MAYEDSAGLGVHNQYGPRASGGEQGNSKTYGSYNEYELNLPLAGLYNYFPVRNNVKVIGVNTSFATGTVSAVAIGGVAVLAATEAAPVAIADGNTGVVTQTGGTAGTIIIRYINVSGDAFAWSPTQP